MQLWLCCYDDKYTKPVKIYREDSIKKFMQEMLKEVQYCQKIMKSEFNNPLELTDEDEQEFKTAEECHICGQKYSDKDVCVRDH